MAKRTMAERMARKETDIDYIKKELDEHKELIKGFIDSADRKFASKLVERIVYGLCAVILLAVVGAIIALVVVG